MNMLPRKTLFASDGALRARSFVPDFVFVPGGHLVAICLPPPTHTHARTHAMKELARAFIQFAQIALSLSLLVARFPQCLIKIHFPALCAAVSFLLLAFSCVLLHRPRFPCPQFLISHCSTEADCRSAKPHLMISPLWVRARKVTKLLHRADLIVTMATITTSPRHSGASGASQMGAV